MESTAGVIEQIRLLLEMIIEKLGATTTLVLVVAILGAFFLYRVFQEWRKDKEVHLAIQAHQEALQRCANENRELRIVLLRAIAGWTDDDIERYIMKADFRDPKESRQVIEGRQPRDRSGGAKGRSKRKEGRRK